MPTDKRLRVSYVIPPPTEQIPRLQLPRSAPTAYQATPRLQHHSDQSVKHGSVGPNALPRHRLGVLCLAVDKTTQLIGREEPGGILYSGSRDGQILSFDLDFPMKRKTSVTQYTCDWERRTGWEEDGSDSDDEDNQYPQRPLTSLNLRKDDQWEVDAAQIIPESTAHFRQSCQSHSDWVNDIALCNDNQNVVSASSDGKVRLWRAHQLGLQEPITLGMHSDYAKCLAYPTGQNWVASGSFDRTIKLWDLNYQAEAIMTMTPPDVNSEKNSVYSLAVDPQGSCMASGSPERVIRTWDPKSGKRISKLMGHTDNVRAMVMSEDAKWLLTGSADSTIKLWSLAAQRCLHTFSHHSESIWSLFSSHPSLENFYSGDKSGIVSRVDVEGCADMSDGECLVLCRDTDDGTLGGGIAKLAVLDDNILFTASTSSSNIQRWLIPPRRMERTATHTGATESPTFFRQSPDLPRRDMTATPQSQHRPTSTSPKHSFSGPRSDEISSLHNEGNTLFGMPYESLVKLPTTRDSPSFLSPFVRDPEVATMYSAASIESGAMLDPRHQSLIRSGNGQSGALLQSREDVSEEDQSPRALFEDRDLCTSAAPLLSRPDFVIHGDKGLVRAVILNDRLHALTINVEGDCGVWDLVRCACLGYYDANDVALAVDPQSDSKTGTSPRKALEAVRERIEGHAAIVNWSTADTKAGVLTVHINQNCYDSEIYTDEVGLGDDKRYNEESRVNIGQWAIRNLFLAFIREEGRLAKENSTYKESSQETLLSTHGQLFGAPSEIPTASFFISSNPYMIPAKPSRFALPNLAVDGLSTPQAFRPGTGEATPMPQSNNEKSTQGDYFSVKTFAPSPVTAAEAKSPESAVPSTPTAGAGLMGRFKTFGKGIKKSGPDSGVATPSVEAEAKALAEAERAKALAVEEAKTPRQLLLEKPIVPPSSREAPTIHLPKSVSIWITEDAYPSWRPLYRGNVESTAYDRAILKDITPLWILEYLWSSNSPGSNVVKVGFVLLPFPNSDGSTLPELINSTQSKLTASRFLRVRKLCNHVKDKLDKMNDIDNASVSSFDRASISSVSSRNRAEDSYEILCNDIVLPLNMTLAAIRQYIWRQTAELTMYYRAKTTIPSL